MWRVSPDLVILCDERYSFPDISKFSWKASSFSAPNCSSDITYRLQQPKPNANKDLSGSSCCLHPLLVFSFQQAAMLTQVFCFIKCYCFSVQLMLLLSHYLVNHPEMELKKQSININPACLQRIFLLNTVWPADTWTHVSNQTYVPCAG